MTDDIQNPVPEFVVSAEPIRDVRGMINGHQAISKNCNSPDGLFRLHLPNNGPWRVTAAENDRTSAPHLVPPLPQGRTLLLVVPRSSSLSGVVTDKAGQPLDGAAVFVFRSSSEYPKHGQALLLASGLDATYTVTDQSGFFEFTSLRHGQIKVVAQHPSYADSTPVSVRLAPGQVVTSLQIVMASGGRVAGNVNRSELGVIDCDVALYSFKGMIGWREAPVDGAGAFSIKNVIPQDYIIELRRGVDAIIDGSSSHDRKRIRVREGETTHVQFGSSGKLIRIAGALLSNESLPEKLEVRACPAVGQDRLADDVSKDGRFELMVDTPGEYEFYVSSGPGSFARFSRTVPDQDRIEFRFDLPGGGIVGRIVDAGGFPVPRVPVTLEWAAENAQALDVSVPAVRSLIANEEGIFEFLLLEPGDYNLRALDGRRNTADRRLARYGRAVAFAVTVGHGVTGGVSLCLTRGARIHGVLVDSDGLAVDAALIRLADSFGRLQSVDWETKTNTDGTFVLRHVAPGNYNVLAQRNGSAILGPLLTVDKSDVVCVRIEM